MDYHNDPAFQEYFTEIIDDSPFESLASSYQCDPGLPDQIVTSEDYLYGIVGDGAVSYDHVATAPVNEVSPMACVGGGSKKKGGKKRKRDPNKPKGWLTAVLLYSNANRPRVKLENPNATFGDIGRLLSAEFKALLPELMAMWEKASADDRARYNHEMLSYVPTARVSLDSCGTSGSGLEETFIREYKVPKLQPIGQVTKKRKNKKDPNAPKRSLSAWQIYSSGESRKQVQAQYPGASVKEIMGILSQKFKLLAYEERAPLDVMAAADKERYQREMSVYNGGHAFQCH